MLGALWISIANPCLDCCDREGCSGMPMRCSGCLQCSSAVGSALPTVAPRLHLLPGMWKLAQSNISLSPCACCHQVDLLIALLRSQTAAQLLQRVMGVTLASAGLT